jgi:glycosyltransferase involved in cell wall biosynthesis
MSLGTPAVFFTGDIFRSQRLGGISRYILQLHRHLRQLGVTTTIGGTGSISQMMDPHDARVMSIPGDSRYSRLAGHLVGRLDDRRIVRQLPKQAVVHSTYYGPHVRWDRPHVLTVHDLTSHRFKDLATDRYTRFMKQHAEAADLVLTGSNHSRGDIVELLGIAEEKIRVVYHGVTEPNDQELSTLTDLPGQYILFVGQRSGYKNWARLVEALGSQTLRKDIALVCFGGPPPSDHERQLINRAGLLPSQVLFRSGDDLRLGAAYRGAEMLVYPSLYEGFGLPPLEAMIRGCPVIASNSTSLPEVVGDAGLLVDATDVDSVIAGIEAMRSTPLRDRLIEAGRIRAASFGWERSARETLDAYSSLVAQS